MSRNTRIIDLHEVRVSWLFRQCYDWVSFVVWLKRSRMLPADVLGLSKKM